jgi:hypothetical protein
VPGSNRLRSRLPVHLSLTRAVSGRLPLLEAKVCQTLAALRQQQELALQPGAPPAPQLLALAVVARVLAAEHVAAGRYLPAEEAAVAQGRLLRGGAAGAEELPLALGGAGGEGCAAAAEAALQGLLAEVWADADVAAAFAPGALGAPGLLPGIAEVRAGPCGSGRAEAAVRSWGGRAALGDCDAGSLLASLDFQQAAKAAMEAVLAGVIQEELGQLRA